MGIGAPRSKWVRRAGPRLPDHPPDGRPVLVDTAFHASVAAKPSANLGRVMARVRRPRIEPGQDIPAQLRERGHRLPELGSS